MAAAELLLRWLVDGTLAVSAATLLVLALRRPLRRAFGARLAYGAWALVPLALLAALLPRPDAARLLMPELVALHPGLLVQAASGAATGTTAPAAGIDWTMALAALWLAGAALAALAVARRQRRFVARLGRLRRDAGGSWRGDGVESPAVVGALRPRIVLPTDFEARHAPEEAALVVAHERAHLARGDTRATLAAVALRCLQWFNPLLHLAERRFRLDQELACDATVLARHPHARRRYADAMLNVQLAVPGLPVGCHWQSSQSLKERILMLKQPQPRAGRRRAGVLVLGATLAACSYAAWAVRPAATTTMTTTADVPPLVTPAAGVAPPAMPATAERPPRPAMPEAPPAPPAPPAPAMPDMPAMPAAPATPAAPPAPPAPAAPPAPPAPPAPLMAPPKYPAEAAAAGVDGRVVLKLLVRTDGSVKDVVVERSEPAGVFDANAVEAARMWKLTPGMKDGRPVEGWVRVPIDFEAPAPAVDGEDGAALQWMRTDGPVRTLSCDVVTLDANATTATDARCGIARR